MLLPTSANCFQAADDLSTHSSMWWDGEGETLTVMGTSGMPGDFNVNNEGASPNSQDMEASRTGEIRPASEARDGSTEGRSSSSCRGTTREGKREDNCPSGLGSENSSCTESDVIRTPEHENVTPVSQSGANSTLTNNSQPNTGSTITGDDKTSTGSTVTKVSEATTGSSVRKVSEGSTSSAEGEHHVTDKTNLDKSRFCRRKHESLDTKHKQSWSCYNSGMLNPGECYNDNDSDCKYETCN